MTRTVCKLVLPGGNCNGRHKVKRKTVSYKLKTTCRELSADRLIATSLFGTFDA